MTLVGELRRAPELAAAPVAALTRDGLLARALHAEPERSIAVMPNNEEATVEVWPSLDHVAAAFEAATSADAEAKVADADDVNDRAAASAMPEPAAMLDLGDGKPLPVLIPESEQFANRLRKNARLRRKWPKREGVSCYRVYDADLPDYSAAIDLYEGCPQTPGRWLVIAEYAAPKTIDPALAQARMLDILAIAPRILDVPAEHVHAKARMRSRGGSQYGKQGAGKGGLGERANIARRRLPLIEEGGLTFAVNFDDYLDVGIFLDHRVTRNLVREHAKQARRFLNLFAYTGTATCYAADGGVEETVTVDLSNTYLDWAERNMRQNGFVGPQHHFVRDDVLAWIRDQRQTRNRWDLIFVDPPTFSNSSKMGRRTWDVQRDHVELLAGVSRLLAQGGHAIFSCNLRGFRPETRKLARAGVVLEDITAQTIPEDFARNQKVHHCYIVRRLPIEDAMAEVGFSAEEIAERLDMPVDKVREIMRVAQEPVSLETPIGEEEDSHLGDFIPDDDAPVPAEAASQTLLKEQLADVLKTLTPREEKVLRLRFGLEDGRPRTLEEVGKEFNVTRERIRQIEAKALRKLRHPSRSKKLKDFLN